jgi:hypothetical protein
MLDALRVWGLPEFRCADTGIRPTEYDGASGRLKLASLRRESSNQLLETLEEWNDYLER